MDLNQKATFCCQYVSNLERSYLVLIYFHLVLSWELTCWKNSGNFWSIISESCWNFDPLDVSYWSNILITKDRAWPHFQTPRGKEKNTTHSRVLLMNFEVFGNVVKHSLESVVYLFNRGNVEINSQKSVMIKMRYPNTVTVVISFAYTWWIKLTSWWKVF